MAISNSVQFQFIRKFAETFDEVCEPSAPLTELLPDLDPSSKDGTRETKHQRVVEHICDAFEEWKLVPQWVPWPQSYFLRLWSLEDVREDIPEYVWWKWWKDCYFQYFDHVFIKTLSHWKPEQKQDLLNRIGQMKTPPEKIQRGSVYQLFSFFARFKEPYIPIAVILGIAGVTGTYFVPVCKTGIEKYVYPWACRCVEDYTSATAQQKAEVVYGLIIQVKTWVVSTRPWRWITYEILGQSILTYFVIPEIAAPIFPLYGLVWNVVQFDPLGLIFQVTHIASHPHVKLLRTIREAAQNATEHRQLEQMYQRYMGCLKILFAQENR